MAMYALKASIALLVVGIGLEATMRDATYLLRHPALFARTIVSMHVVMPALTLAMCVGLAIPRAIQVALLALSISPVPPFLPPRVTKAAGKGSYAIGLLVATSLLSVVIVPLSLRVLGTMFDLSIRTPMPAVAKVVVLTVLGPLAIGMLVGRLVPASVRFAKPLTTAATVTLAAATVPLLVSTWPEIRVLLGNGTLLVIATVTVAGLAAGHLLGAPARKYGTVLALSTASRHPAVAITVATANFPGDRLMVPAILLALIVSALAATPYVTWSRRAAARGTVRT